MPIKIFFCYAHEDRPLLNELKVHLAGLKRQGLIEMWYDGNISAGAEWADEIDKHLNTAEIILLLVSQYFIDSDYCYSIEMKKAIKRHERGEAIVIPIILRPVNIQGTPFGKLEALPTKAKPVKSWDNPDEAFFDVSEGIRKIVEGPISQFSYLLLTSSANQISFKKELSDKKEVLSNQHLLPHTLSNLPAVASASESVHMESLFEKAIIAQSNGNLEEALELYWQIHKQDPNFRKGQPTSQLKKLLLQKANEASRRDDKKSQIKYLNELLTLDTNDTDVQKRLERASSTYIKSLRVQATSARQASNWEIEYKCLEEILKLRPQDSEAKKYIKPANINYLRQQARNARKKAAWDDEVSKWDELLALQKTNVEAKRRRAIAKKNQDHKWRYDDVSRLISEGRPDEAKDALRNLWMEAPYYGDPRRLAKKVGILIPLPLEKWRKAIWLIIFTSLVVLLIISIIWTFLSNTPVLLFGMFIDGYILYGLYRLSKYWLLMDW